MKYVLGVSIFLAVAENYMALQALGAMLLLVYLGIAVSFGWSFISYACMRAAALATFPLYWAVLLSIGCLANVYPTVGFIVLKLVLLFLVVGITPASVAGQAITLAIWWHTAFFLLHFLFLLAGAGNIWDSIVFLDTQTDFHGSSYVPFRATGLFDEPSLFGMTMLSLVLSNYFVSGSVRGIAGPMFSFSLPTMAYGVLIRFLDSIRRPGVAKYALLFVMPVVAFMLYRFGADRESNVKLSPLMLRLNHFLLFFQSEKLYWGNGFCSAYGSLDLAMSKEDLRRLYLGNFKDAGQLLFIADRIGLIGFILYFSFLARTLPLHLFLMFVIYLGLTKVPYFSFAGTVVFTCLSQYIARKK